MIEQVLLYLGIHGEADDETIRLILLCRDELEQIAAPKITMRVMDYSAFLPFMEGEDIKKHLEHAKQIIVLAATLGIAVDTEIKKYQAVDMAHAAVLDACAAAYIEAYLDAQNLDRDGLYATMRFSPGYGDYPLTMQPKLLQLTRADRIGVSALPSLMLVPAKSVTAVVGLTEKPQCKKEKCQFCNKKDCSYRRKK